MLSESPFAWEHKLTTSILTTKLADTEVPESVTVTMNEYMP